jgi:glycosyltransferase involved in cell wall biosynthesis
MPQSDNFRVAKLLSVVIPAYKQERTIVKDILSIEESIKAIGCPYEILVVVDGVLDKTYQKAQTLRSAKIKVLSYEKNQGKGHAVRYGMLQARGDVIGFIDAGMEIHPNGLVMLLNHMTWYNADIIVGSKLHPVSKVKYPFYRKVLSWGYRSLTRLLFGFKIRDTQVGIKFFKRNVIKQVLPLLLVKHYAFDIELLAVAYHMGFTRIYEAPVEIRFNAKSSAIVSKALWKIIFLMLWDTAAVFYRLRILNYYASSENRKYVKAMSIQ